MTIKSKLKNAFPELFKIYVYISNKRYEYYHAKCVRLCYAGDFKAAIKLSYKINIKGEKIDFTNPQRLSDKFQCLKVGEYYNNPLTTRCADKVTAKEYVKEKGLSCHVAKLYQVCDSVDELDWDSLPEQFVLKCNHGCGYNIVCTDKSCFDIDAAKSQLSKWLSEDYWAIHAEPIYKFIVKKVFAEEYLGNSIDEYKFFCFNGEPKVVNLPQYEEGRMKFYDFYDMNFNLMDITSPLFNARSPEPRQKPERWEELKQIAIELAKPFPFVRVDLGDTGKEIVFTELTFLPNGGNCGILPSEIDRQWGEWLKI